MLQRFALDIYNVRPDRIMRPACLSAMGFGRQGRHCSAVWADRLANPTLVAAAS